MPLFVPDKRPYLIVASSTYTGGGADYRCDGVNDQTEIQAAIDALGATGGTVYLTEGTFTIAHAGSFTADSLTNEYCLFLSNTTGPIQLIGAGIDATTIKLANQQQSDSILILVRGTDATRRTDTTWIEGITFDGNTTNQTGGNVWADFGMIQMAYAENLSIVNCRLTDAPYFGMQAFRDAHYLRYLNNRHEIGASAKGQLRIESSSHIVQNNWFIGSTTATAGVLMDLSANLDIGATFLARSISIQGNIFVGGWRQLTLSGAQECTLFGNVFRDALDDGAYSVIVDKFFDAIAGSADSENNLIVGNIWYNVRNALRLAGDASDGTKRTLVTNNQIIRGPDVFLINGIEEQNAAAVADNHIRDNFCYAFGGGINITISSATSTARGNTNFVTETGGTGTITSGNTAVTITHGLARTPTAANISITPTATTTNDPGNIWVDTITSTQFNVNCRNNPGASGMAFGWQAVIL